MIELVREFLALYPPGYAFHVDTTGASNNWEESQLAEGEVFLSQEWDEFYKSRSVQ